MSQQIPAGGIIPAGELVPGLPPALGSVLAMALHRNPTERYADAGELAAALAGGG